MNSINFPLTSLKSWNKNSSEINQITMNIVSEFLKKKSEKKIANRSVRNSLFRSLRMATEKIIVQRCYSNAFLYKLFAYTFYLTF